MMKKMRCGWIGIKATGLDWAAKLSFALSLLIPTQDLCSFLGSNMMNYDACRRVGISIVQSSKI